MPINVQEKSVSRILVYSHLSNFPTFDKSIISILLVQLILHQPFTKVNLFTVDTGT